MSNKPSHRRRAKMPNFGELGLRPARSLGSNMTVFDTVEARPSLASLSSLRREAERHVRSLPTVLGASEPSFATTIIIMRPRTKD